VRLADPGPTPPPNRSFTPARTPAARSMTPPLTPAARAMTPARTPARSPTPAHTPAARTPTPPRTPSNRASGSRPAVPDPSATPPPETPLPPARTRGYTPFKASDPELTPRATPQPQHPANRGPSNAAHAGGNRVQPGTTMRGPAPTNPRRPAPVAGAGQPASVRTRQTGPRDAVAPGTPAYGVQRPPPQDFALAPTIPPPGSMSRGVYANPNPNRVHRETARVQYRPPRQWGGLFTVVLLVLAAAAVVVHLKVMPLDVAIAWREPTGLSIKTDPTGATVRVDGVPLASTTPATVTVWRDTKDHVIEASHPGYQTSRATVRYDKSASLSFVILLPRDPDTRDPTGLPPPAQK